MNTTTIHTHMTVDELLQQVPGAFSVFLQNKTKCVGCFMQQFCTLQDVAETYQIRLETLIEQIDNLSK